MADSNRPLTVLSYPVVMSLLVVLTFVLVLLGSWYWKLGLSTLYLLAVPIALAAAYLAWYRTLPYHPPETRPSGGAFPADTEPFEDPVEEADRLDEEKEEEKIAAQEDEEDAEERAGENARPSDEPDSP